MRSFQQLTSLDAPGIQRLIDRVFSIHGPHFVKLALCETAPSLREHLFTSMSEAQRRAVIDAKLPAELSHDDLPAARWQIMEIAAEMEGAGELEFQ